MRLGYIFTALGFMTLALVFVMQNSLASDTHKKDTRPYIVTTTAQIADIARNIGGQDIRVKNLMGSGIDPHLYRPTRSDIVELRSADIVFYNGLHLEGQMGDVLDKMKAEKPVISIGDNLPDGMLMSDATGEKTYDPHIWMDVKTWIAGSDIVLSTLKNADKTLNNKALSYRADTYKAQLTKLDADIKKVIQTIPENARTLVTAHDAFGYLGNAYGLNVVGIQGLSTESEAGLKRMEELAMLLTTQKIPAVFAETSVSDANINALIENARRRGHHVYHGGALYSDAMGASNTPEGTYVGMMQHNVRTLSNALGGVKNAFLSNKRYADASL